MYKKRAQTKRLRDGETRLVPGSENESTDVLFEKTRRERVVRTLLLLFFYEAHVRVLLRKVFPFERRRDFKEEEERRKKTASLSLSLFSRKNQK